MFVFNNKVKKEDLNLTCEKIYNILEPYIEFKNTIFEPVIDIIKLYYSDYIIFLTNKFFNLKKKLLVCFDKYNVVYFNYADKNKIINIINIINNFIKKSDNIAKNNFIDILNETHNDFFNNTKKMKQIFFSENIYEPDILYKKIHFSNQEIFIPFDQYIIKKMEYKLRTFCQIAEKLGAEKIIIDYNSSKHVDNNINLNMNFFSSMIGTNYESKQDNNEDIQIIFEYPNNHSDININKFYLIDSILNENEFLISKEDFESDLELKFLIDTRCINFIQKYHTNFIINHINKIEQKIFLKAHNYGLNIGNLNLKNNFIKISINIDFFQIQNNFDIIDGTNIHVLREGFIHLANIIKKDNKYIKLLRFLQSHLNAVEKKWIYLNYDFDNVDKVNKIYNDIINLNFKEDEICDIINGFFTNNLTWYNFKKFRDLILKGSDTNIEKIYFITFQYHDIMNNKKHIMYDVDKCIDFYINNFINNFNKFEINEIQRSNSISEQLIESESFDQNDEKDMSSNIKQNKSVHFEDICDIIEIPNINNDNYNIIVDFLNKYKNNIKVILYASFCKSFKFINGLSDNLTNSDKLNIVIKNIIIYYFDNDIKNLQMILNNNLNNNFDFNIKKKIFEELINKLCIEIIQNKRFNLSESSPNINLNQGDNYEKSTLYKRVQKIFLKFVIKYFDNDIDNKISKKLNINILEPESLLRFLNDFIKISQTYKNYNKYKLFYTWDDFINIKNYF